jgi:hypothetical protein
MSGASNSISAKAREEEGPSPTPSVRRVWIWGRIGRQDGQVVAVHRVSRGVRDEVESNSKVLNWSRVLTLVRVRAGSLARTDAEKGWRGWRDRERTDRISCFCCVLSAS